MSGPQWTAPRLEKKLSTAWQNDRNESPRVASSATGIARRRGETHERFVRCHVQSSQAADEGHLAVRDLLLDVVGAQQRPGLDIEGVRNREIDVHRRARPTALEP